MKDLTIEKAYELAVKKWQWIVDNNGSSMGLFEVIPEIEQYVSGCSYCYLYIELDCHGCPLRIPDIRWPGCSCAGNSHQFYIWFNHKTKANAQAVLDLIIKTKPF